MKSFFIPFVFVLGIIVPAMCNMKDAFPQRRRKVECGKMGKSYQQSVASYAEFPWIVSVEYKHEFSCIGTLINKRYVLTTAKCVEDKSTNGDLGILAGLHESNVVNRQTGVQLRIAKSKTIYNDPKCPSPTSFAIIEVMKDFNLTKNVQKLCISKKIPESDLNNCFAARWKKDDDNFRYVLEKMNTTVKNSDKHQGQVYKKSEQCPSLISTVRNTEELINEAVLMCQKGKHQNYYLVGMFAKREDSNDLYRDTTSVYKWIEETIK